MIGASYQGRNPSAMVERVLIVRGGALGDFVLTVPVLRALGRGGNAVDLCCGDDAARLATACGLADSTTRLDDARWGGLWSGGEPGPIASTLRRYDRVVVLRPVDPHAIAPVIRAWGVDRVAVHDPTPPGDGSVHAADHLLAATGSPRGRAVPRLSLPSAWKGSSRRRLRALGRGPTALLFPGAGAEEKRWPLRGFLDLADELHRLGWSVAAVTGPVEADRIGPALGGQPTGPAAVLDVGDVLELAGLCAVASVVVGNDSGPAHLAAALGTPVVSLFGPTDERTWGPRGDGAVRILRGEDGQSEWAARSWESLSVESVTAAVVALAIDGRSGGQ